MSSRARKILGTITLAATIPALIVAVNLVAEFSFPFTDWLLIEKIAIVLTGGVGGLLVFVGKRPGIPLAIITWVLVFWQGCSTIYQLYPAAQTGTINIETANVGLYKAAIELILSVIMIILLIREYKATSALRITEE